MSYLIQTRKFKSFINVADSHLTAHSIVWFNHQAAIYWQVIKLAEIMDLNAVDSYINGICSSAN